MKQFNMLCTFAVILAIMLQGCSNTSVAEEEKTEPSEEAITTAIPTKVPAVAAMTTQKGSSGTKVTPSLAAILTPTIRPVQAPTMKEIAIQYMNNLKISEDCPASAYEKRDDVTYGTIVHKLYYSKTTGLARGVNIILPANYDEAKQYPVLYLLHGIKGDENSLVMDGNCKIVQIIGNLIADNIAEDMIVVFPDIFATTEIGKVADFEKESVEAYDNFINDLTKDLMPYMSENYSILPGRENQAIAGFSMGGREALYIGITRPDLFGYVAGISPAPGLTPGKDWALEHPGQLQEEELRVTDDNNFPYIIMVCCGTNDSVVGAFPKSYHDILTRNDVKHIWYEVPGADHDAQAIRSGVYNFCSAIFHTEK